MNITQEDIKLLKQSSRTVYSKFDILNSNFKAIGNLSGELISDTYSYDVDSNHRKSINMNLFVKDSSLLIGSDKKIWFDKYVRVSMGIYNLRTREIVWYLIGTFVYIDTNYNYDATTKELSISLVDMTALLDGTRNGKLKGLQTKIIAGTNIREAMVSTITQLGGILKYRIDAMNGTVPYDLEFSTGATVWDVVCQLRDLYVGWQTYFDNDVFVCERYPTKTNDPIVLDDIITHDLIISEGLSQPFTGMKNVIELWGKCNETDYYSTDVSYSSNTYAITNTAVTELKDGELYGFKASADNLGNDYIKINSFTLYPLYGENNISPQAGRIKADNSYVIKFKSNGSMSYFYFYGEYQISSVVKLVSRELTNAEKLADIANEPTNNVTYVVDAVSPYCTDLIGEVRDPKSSGEYDNIYSEDLATQRAEYELWKVTDMIDTINLSMIEIPWLEVNQKIQYTSLNTGVTEVYIIKQKSGSTTQGTMSLNCVKFKPTYSWE